MTVGMAGLAFGGRAENGRNIAMALDIGLLREIQVPAIGLAFARKGRLEIFRGPGIL
jgi:hypothetical protein